MKKPFHLTSHFLRGTFNPAIAPSPAKRQKHPNNSSTRAVTTSETYEVKLALNIKEITKMLRQTKWAYIWAKNSKSLFFSSSMSINICDGVN